MNNNNNSDNFPAFVAMHTAPDIHSDTVRSERELGEWYANYDVQCAWFEGGTLFQRNHRGQVSELCKADTEDEAYNIMAERAHKDDRVWFINIESLMDGDDDGENVAAMVQKLREVKS